MRSATLLFVALLPATLLSADPTVALRQPWRQPYQGDDATGKHVVALWRFDEGAELADSSGNGHTASQPHGGNGRRRRVTV